MVVRCYPLLCDVGYSAKFFRYRRVVYYTTSAHCARSHARWRDSARAVVRECGTVDMCRLLSAPGITPMTCVPTGERCHHLSAALHAHIGC